MCTEERKPHKHAALKRVRATLEALGFRESGHIEEAECVAEMQKLYDDLFRDADAPPAAAQGEAVLYGRIDSESGEIAMKDGVYQVAEFFSSEFPVALYLAPPAAGAVPAVDWRELYRIQTAMRYMDNNPGLTRDHAFSWADQDIAAMLAAANKENNNERQ